MWDKRGVRLTKIRDMRSSSKVILMIGEHHPAMNHKAIEELPEIDPFASNDE